MKEDHDLKKFFFISLNGFIRVQHETFLQISTGLSKNYKLRRLIFEKYLWNADHLLVIT